MGLGKTYPSVEGLRAYERELAQANVGRLRLGLLLGSVLVPAFWLLDLLAYPERARFFLALRLGVAGCFVGLFWISTRRWSKPWGGLLRILTIAFVGLTINVMIRFTGGYASPYYAGLSLVFLVAGVIIRFNVREAAIGYGTCYVIYLLGIALLDEVRDFGLLANNNMFLLSSLLVALVGSHLAERLERKEFFSRYALSQANRKLREVDQLKSRFFASVSHELRTPLTLLLAPTESLLAEEVGRLAGQARRFVELIHANALKLLQQINDLLDLARLDAERMELNVAPVDLGPLVGALVRTAEPLASQRGIELRYAAERSADTVPVDGEKVEKVVLNLISNALKFTPPGGRVEVLLRQTASGARITISDTGIGVPRKDLERIFDRFAQVDASGTRRYPGSGIGLALVKELVELHKGWVDVESEPGIGSRFSVTLPSAPGEAALRRSAESAAGASAEKPEGDGGNGEPGVERAGAATASTARAGTDLRQLQLADLADAAPMEASGPPRAAAGDGALAAPLPSVPEGPPRLRPSTGVAVAPAASSQTPAAAGRPTVVVMEDNSQLREFLTTLLGREYRVLEAADGDEGLNLARAVRPDLVVADVMMPGKSGLDVCRALKQDPDPGLATTPVLLLTAKAELAARLEGYEQGADDYLVKPFNSKELMARARVLLRLRALEQALARRNRELAGKLSTTRDQLLQAEKLSAIGQLAAGVAHEINNPLTSVISFAQLLLKGRVTEADARRCLELIAAEGERAARIIRSLLAFARKHKPERRLQPLGPIIEAVLELRVYAIERAGITIERDFAELPPVMVDPHQLQQVFLNILINAEQALSERRSGRIVVRTRAGEGVVRVAIADDGPGIAPEDLPRIFDPFYSTKDVGQGTGLGLSICYGIIQEHQGRIWAESEPGGGATFWIELPMERNS
jgi:signal transduction histidine kinase